MKKPQLTWKNGNISRKDLFLHLSGMALGGVRPPSTLEAVLPPLEFGPGEALAEDKARTVQRSSTDFVTCSGNYE